MKFIRLPIHAAISARLFMSALLALALLVFLGACASYSGYGLKPGIASESDVRQAMGEPAARWNTSSGDVWAFPRGPLGVQTFLVHFDDNGTLKIIEPVLDYEHFAKIAPNMTQEDVLHRIGPPFQTITFVNLNQMSWDYHYNDLWGYSSIFSVIFSQGGRVKYTFTQREFAGGDRQ